MSCEYHEIRNRQPFHMCTLKQKSDIYNSDINSELSRLGLGSSHLGDDCPVAEALNWEKCPFRITPLK